MHARRLACFVLGLWLGGGLLVACLTWVNLRMADHMESQASPAVRLEWKARGGNAGALLRYQASEQNREYRRIWDTAQLILGCGFFGVMLFGSRESKSLLGGILLLVVVVALERFVVTPAVTAQGRLLESSLPDATWGETSRYGVLQIGYRAVEGVKWLLTVVLAGRLVFSRKGSGRSRDSRLQLDLVNKANYRGVNR
jgi:hypothetical protein